ncbi:(Fe-S)-binding protein [Nocardia sp. CNY236]|uniref:(Fe-S)-binding protein n=1 Tax=Nocardia sp. CNY236 TaxID=1169152 RepID=UPI00040A5755|nr:(Fe-S)-binding protein [Nocardia sp. CNY236]
MSPLQITLGAISILIGVPAWAGFVLAVRRMVRTIRLGQPAPDRWRPFGPRLATVIKEFAAHTRMVKFRTVGWAHWLVMVGFLIGFVTVFQAQGQIFDPMFTWPWIGHTRFYHLLDELLGLGTIVGGLVLITIRQLNHPRRPARLSRFSGSNFLAAYFVEAVVVVEGISMVGVKALVVAYTGEHDAISDFVSMQIAKVVPASASAVSVFAFFKLMAALVWVVVVSRNIDWGVAWHRFAAFFNIYFKREKDGGVALGAAKPMMSNGKALDMENVDVDTDILGVGKFEDFSWKDILDVTTCTECGRCQSQCPAWNTGKPLSPKLLIMSLRDHGYAKAPYLLAGGRTDTGGDEVGLVDADGKPDEPALAKISADARAEAERPLVSGEDMNGIIDPEVLWSCTTCGACVEQCPVDIEHVDHIIDMRRYQVLIESEFPSELAGLFKNLENKGNPWGQNAKDRINWISELDFDIPVFQQDADSFDGYEYLFWVGCAGAYEDRAKKTTKAVAELLATAGVKFMVLGQGETCTGDSARRAGNEFLFQQLAQQNIEMLNEVFDGVPQARKKIVVTCAHCFNTLNNEYPQVGGTYEVVHHTQLLNRLVRAKKLVPVSPVTEKVTYHDPCYLGRHNKVYNAPRELMEGAGAVLTEMPRHGERSMCCGAGGARMWMEENLGKRINIDRVDEALSTLDGGNSAAMIATGCPFCRVMLTDGVTARKDSGEIGQAVEVVDVAQLMLQSIEKLAPETLSANLTVIQTPKAAPEPEVIAEAAPAAPAAKPTGGGLGMKGAAKAPGGGLGMKGGAKAPGAKPAAAPAAPAESAAPAAESAAPATESAAPSVESAATETKPTLPAKGLAMKSGFKRPGVKAPGAAAPAAPAAEPAAAPAVESSSSATTSAAEAPSPAAKVPAAEASAEGNGTAAAPPAAKPGGLGFKSGTKAPGRKS